MQKYPIGEHNEGLRAILHEVISEGSYVEIQITDKMRQYTRRSRFGLALIALGFLLQLIAAWPK